MEEGRYCHKVPIIRENDMPRVASFSPMYNFKCKVYNGPWQDAAAVVARPLRGQCGQCMAAATLKDTTVRGQSERRPISSPYNNY